MTVAMTEGLTSTLSDSLAVSLERAMTTASKQAQEAGVDTQHSRVSVTQQHSEEGFIWRIYFGHPNPVGRRGGGLTVDVSSDDGTIIRVLRGQ